MSLAQKVAALRAFFGVSDGMPLLLAVESMNVTMGIVAEGPLPAQVETLVLATGVTIAGAAEGSGAATAQPPPPQTQTRKPSAGPVSTSQPASVGAVQPPARPLGQTDIRGMMGPKLYLEKKMLKAAAASSSGARPFEQVEMEAALVCEELPSEKRERLGVPDARPKIQYQCVFCGKLCGSPAGLVQHEKWQHSPDAQPVSFLPPPKPTFNGELAAKLEVGEAGVSVAITINSKTRGDLRRERAEADASWAAAKAEREAEQIRRAEARRLERDAQDVEHRRGSDRRRSYSAKEKLEVHDFYQRIRGDKGKGKCKRFEEDKRSRGATWSLVSRWDRREIEKAAGWEHAGTLLRIDKESRRKGKWALMEKQLYARFKQRRARARKCSPKWFVHTARYIMRTEFSGEAAGFRGSRSWMRRFFKRFSLVRRKKTNVKNTTWEDTKPVRAHAHAAARLSPPQPASCDCMHLSPPP